MPVFRNLAVSITDDLDERVRAAADREAISVSAVVRRALTRYFFGRDLTQSNGNNDANESPSVIASAKVSTDDKVAIS